MSTQSGPSTGGPAFDKTFPFHGLEVVQNPSQPKQKMFIGTINSLDLADIVSIDNPVAWDTNSQAWKTGGRNRTIEPSHWKSIRDYLQSSTTSMLPSPIIVSVENSAFKFSPFPQQAVLVHGVRPGVIELKAPFVQVQGQSQPTPVDEDQRVAWVVDGQHRIRAFRDSRQSMPLNVLIIPKWSGPTYDDVMRHQTYELNMGRPLTEDFRAAVREGYKSLIGGDAYKSEIAVSWIRKDLEVRGGAFGVDVVGAPKLRVPYKIRMSLVESVVRLAYSQDSYLQTNYPLTSLTSAQVVLVGDYLFNFFEGVRLSLGLIAPMHRAQFAPLQNYWDAATLKSNSQRLLHNVGLKAVTRALLHDVMRVPGPNGTLPKTPQDVAKRLHKMRGIPWHDSQLLAAKDDWVKPLSNALAAMYADPNGTSSTVPYTLQVTKGVQSLALNCQW